MKKNENRAYSSPTQNILTVLAVSVVFIGFLVLSFFLLKGTHQARQEREFFQLVEQYKEMDSTVQAYKKNDMLIKIEVMARELDLMEEYQEFLADQPA